MPHDAQARCSTINEWYENFRMSALTVLAESLTRFGAIIHGARFNLNSLMGACVDQLEKFDAEGEVAHGLSTGWKTYEVDALIDEMRKKFVIADGDLGAPSWTGTAPESA